LFVSPPPASCNVPTTRMTRKTKPCMHVAYSCARL
jgi:hypothetical protein